MRSTAALACRLRTLAGGALVVLAAMLPFESVQPLAHIGPLQLSTVEFFLYAAVGSWALALVTAAARSGIRWRWPSGAHVGVALWAAALGVAAICSPAGRGPAIKFFLRSLGGVTLFAASADLLRDEGAARRTALGLTVGAGIGAIAAIAEVHLPAVAPALRFFHVQTFDVLGLRRASGPFQFPNIAAMYFEGIIPVAIALAAVRFHRRPRNAQLAFTLTALTLLYAVALTASRAGLVTAGAAVVVLAVIGCRTPGLAKAALISFCGLAILTVISQLNGSMLGLRQRFWNDQGWYRSSIAPAANTPRIAPSTLDAGETAQVTLVLRNAGAIDWPVEGSRPVRLGFHWIDDANETPAFYDAAPIPLPRDLPPGETALVNVMIRAPARPGSYVLWWDLVRPGAFWFSERGDAGRRERVDVTERAPDRFVDHGVRLPSAPKLIPSSAPLASTAETSRAVLWRAALAAFYDHPLFGVGPDNFRHAYGSYARIPDADDRFHANSLYLEILADEGLVGIAGLVALMAALTSAARRAAASGAERALILGVAVGLGAYFLHGAVDYFFEFTPTYGLFWILAGTLVALGEERRRPEDEPFITAGA